MLPAAEATMRWLDLQHTHARTCHLKPRRVHHAPAPPPPRWLDLQHTHARTCHLKPRRVHHAPAPPPHNRLQPILSFSLGLVLFCTCPKVSHTHTDCFKTLSSTTTLEIAGRRTCPFRQDKSSGLISRAESQKIAV